MTSKIFHNFEKLTSFVILSLNPFRTIFCKWNEKEFKLVGSNDNNIT